MATALAEFQHRMAADVMAPLAADESTQLIEADYVKPNSRLTALERLELYNRQYWFRVIAALQEDFPATQAVVGWQRFEALAVAYLQQHPSRSFTLRNLGSRMAEFLQANPALAGRRAALAIDVARVEWACVEAFDGADLPALSQQNIAHLADGSRIALQPHLQLCELQFPVDDLVIAIHNGRHHSEAASQAVLSIDRKRSAKAPTVRRKQTYLAVHRFDLSIYYRRLQADEYAVLQSLRTGKALGAALEAGMAAMAASADPAVRVADWFQNWAQLGWLCAAEPQPAEI